MAKKKIELSTDESKVKETVGETEKTVLGLSEAERLQKSGWQLIDCHLTPEGKKYKFRKVN